MKLRLNTQLCTGHGRCYALGPDLFREDDRGHCVLVQAEVPPEI